jgi:glycosyltransferase involved in cell wall biosynthesis
MLAPLQNQTVPPVKKVLMIAYLFPPAGGIGVAGSQRVLKFAKYLPRYQWKPVIVTVKEPYYESYISIDQTLIEKVPAETQILRTSVIRWLTKILESKNQLYTKFFQHSQGQVIHEHTPDADHLPPEKGWYQQLKDTVTDFFEIPDEEMGWFLPGVFAGIRAIRAENIEVVYATGRPWTGLIIGAALKALTGKPLVTDFRDPWLTNPFRLKYSPLRNHLEAYLERKVIEKSDVVISNTLELATEFRKRFPQQPNDKFVSLLNGFDSDDYCRENTQQYDHQYFTIVHTGFLYGKRDPKTFLEAVKLLCDKHIVDRNRIKVFFVGSVELPYNLDDYLHFNGLHDVVILQDHIPYKQSLEFLRQADMLLLLQPGTTTQIPSKLFDYLGMRKPILAISPRHGATWNLVTEQGLGEVAPPDDIQEIAAAIDRFYQHWSIGAMEYRVSDSAYQQLNVANLTAMLAAQFSQLSTHSR